MARIGILGGSFNPLHNLHIELGLSALKDYHLAYLVGERTYGKGSVQQVIPLSNIDGFKITMARYYTPSDTNIDKIGIPPDMEVKMGNYSVIQILIRLVFLLI